MGEGWMREAFACLSLPLSLSLFLSLGTERFFVISLGDTLFIHKTTTTRTQTRGTTINNKTDEQTPTIDIKETHNKKTYFRP